MVGRLVATLRLPWAFSFSYQLLALIGYESIRNLDAWAFVVVVES